MDKVKSNWVGSPPSPQYSPLLCDGIPHTSIKNPDDLVTPSPAAFVLAIMTAGTEFKAYPELQY